MSSNLRGRVDPVPERLHTITPRLVVRDGASAIAFYRDAFGAEEVGERFTGPTGELIHAEVCIGDSVVMITDEAAGAATSGSCNSNIPRASRSRCWVALKYGVSHISASG